LKNLAEQVETEGKKEEDLYETFVCWGKSVIAQKKESNLAAESRIDSLKTYIADLDAGKIELTTERQDLEKEVEELTSDLENAKALREKEKKDFESAKAEMEAAIKALEAAIKVMKEATKDSKKGGLLAVDAEVNTGGMAVLEAESANLNAAVDLGERYLSKADAMFLRRIITGDVPEKDHKMLNKKADFKMKYKARSGKIQGVLQKLHFTFEENLRQAESKDKEAAEAYKKLSESKEGMLKKAKGALGKMEVEGAARGLSKSEAEDEKEALEENIKNDKRFIEETEKSLKDKKKEWEERTKLRDGELAAISKAISILWNDDSRDLFKKSYKSQGYLFLQLDSESTQAIVAFNRAVSDLKNAARRTGDRRMSALAALVADGAADPKSVKTKFKPVIKAIDKMIKLMEDEEKKDLKTKEECEEGRMEDTRKSILAGREIDDKTDAITKLEEEIKEIEEQVKLLLEEKKKVKEELEAAEKIRKEETEAWKVTDKDDKEAADTVKDAKQVLQDYYKENFKLLQTGHHAPEVVDGEAPPPPPPTWDGGYGGKKGESTGIISILDMVYEDIKKDLSKAKEEEDTAQEEFDKFEKDSEKQMEDLQDEVDKQNGIKGKKETSRTDTIKERGTKKDEWDGIMKKMAEIAPNCEYYAVNYKMRVSNRQIEIDGLNEAKAVLQGGSFK
jgi:regulator of replication initiation timing